MAKQTDDRLVHHYDTTRQRVSCGASAGDDHSTKHPRGITCSACITVLRERADAAAGIGVDAPSP